MNIREAGALLYWCEGSKREKDCRVELVNSNPEIISVFMRYLRSKGVDETRLRFRLAIHCDDDERSCKDYWKDVTGAGDSSFIATVTRNSSVHRNKLPHGTITVRYNSLTLLMEVKRDISILAERLQAQPRRPHLTHANLREYRRR